MQELPLEIKKLETVRGALDILRYLYQQDSHLADADDIMEELDMSARRFDKAKRRLVTTGYLQRRADYLYELTPRGMESAQLVVEHDLEQEAGDATQTHVERQLVLVLPRNLVVGEDSPLQIGIAPLSGPHNDVDVLLRLQATYAEVGELDEQQRLGASPLVLETTIRPLGYDLARLRLEVFQLLGGGEDVSACGGMYVDVMVLPHGDTGELIAYSSALQFQL